MSVVVQGWAPCPTCLSCPPLCPLLLPPASCPCPWHLHWCPPWCPSGASPCPWCPRRSAPRPCPTAWQWDAACSPLRLLPWQQVSYQWCCGTVFGNAFRCLQGEKDTASRQVCLWTCKWLILCVSVCVYVRVWVFFFVCHYDFHVCLFVFLLRITMEFWRRRLCTGKTIEVPLLCFNLSERVWKRMCARERERGNRSALVRVYSVHWLSWILLWTFLRHHGFNILSCAL